MREARMQGNRWKKPSEGKLPSTAELRLLQLLWESGEATVEGLVQAHPMHERPNYKTTQTLLRIMEQKGFVAHQNRGKAFVFKPLISRKIIDQRAVKMLLSRNFGGSATGLFLNLLEATVVRGEDLDELEAQIQEYRKKNGSLRESKQD